MSDLLVFSFQHGSAVQLPTNQSSLITPPQQRILLPRILPPHSEQCDAEVENKRKFLGISVEQGLKEVCNERGQ